MCVLACIYAVVIRYIISSMLHHSLAAFKTRIHVYGVGVSDNGMMVFCVGCGPGTDKNNYTLCHILN